MSNERTVEEIVSPDGVLDEVAAGKMLDDVLNKQKGETEGLKQETPGDDNPSEDTDDGDSVGDDWVNADDIQELVASLGYSDDEMSEFETEEEFQRHVRLMDRQLRKTRPGDEQERALEADELARTKRERTKRADEQYREDGKFATKSEELPQLDDTYEDDLREVVRARDQRLEEMMAKITELEGQIHGSEQNKLLAEFEATVDSLEMPELFGTSTSMTAKDRERREQVFNEYKEMFNDQESLGRRLTDQANRGLITRAAYLKFADDIRKLDRQKLTSKARKQSAKITGGHKGRSTKNYTGPIEKHPDLLKAYDQMSSENG